MRSTPIKNKLISYLYNADFHNLSSAVVLKALTSLVYILLIPFAISRMGTNNYGITAFFLTIHGYVTLFDTGITYAVNYLYTRELATDRKAADLIYFNSVIIYVALAFLVLLGFAVLSERLSEWAFSTPDYQMSFVIFGFILFFSVFDSFMTSVIQAHEKLMLIAISRFFLDLVKILGVFAVAFGWVGPQNVVLFILLAVIVKILVNVYSFRKLEIKTRFDFNVHILKSILRMSLPSLGISACMLVALMTDKFLVSGKISPSAFAAYSVVIDLTSKVYFVYYSLTTVIYPKLIKNKATGQSVRKLNYVQFGGVLLLSLFYYLPLNLFSERILGLFIKVDENIAPMLLLASVNSLLYLTTTVFENSLNSSAQMHKSFMIHAAGIITLLTGLWLFFDSYGAVGALLSVTGMFCVMNVLFLLFYRPVRAVR